MEDLTAKEDLLANTGFRSLVSIMAFRSFL